MSKSLQVLADNRDALLLAEVGALLHDWQKCIDMAVASHWKTNSQLTSKATEWQRRGRSLSPRDFSAIIAEFSLSDGTNSIDMKTLCEEGKEPSSATNHSNQLVRLLGSCHDFSHVEKELGTEEQREQACDKISDAFGFEYLEPEKLLGPLLCKVKPILELSDFLRQRHSFFTAVQEVFGQAWGDTRRPLNEVTLWDWGYAVASLYKSELAYHFLSNDWRTHNDLRWRILRINFDVLGLYAKAVNVPDLLAYQKAVDKACTAVKQLVEVDYPLGNEVYRDTTGIYFTYPDLDLLPELEQKIRQRMEAVDLELAPRIKVEQSPGATAGEQLKRLLSDARQQARLALVQPFASENLSAEWKIQWENLPAGRWEVCPVCRLRPMQEGQDACEPCLSRRASRVETWLAIPQTTVWMDEIADANGRVALLVGKFGLDDWLSGDLVQTMLVKAVENPPGKCVPKKNPSPARLRRVWETCQRFWTETAKEILERVSPGSRKLVIPDDKTNWRENVPYDGTVNGKAISLLWREQAQHFVTISNLQWLGGSFEENQEIVVSEPDAPGRSRHFKVQGVMPAMGNMGQYNPTLALLESPDQFLALVPATDALEIADKIREEYAKHFGKVQNRLPFFLGLVFFPRKTPLAAVMEAGRRMGEGRMENGEWRIAETPQSDGQRVTLELAQDGQKITLEVPVVMGDGTTEDVWYPYFELVGTPAAHHTYRFDYAGKPWVHVKTLQAGETVHVTPSHCAYLFLEHTAQRFRFDPAQDVQYLGELKHLKEMWEKLCATPDMTDTKLQAIWALFRTKRALWRLDEEAAYQKTFKQLVQTTFDRDKITGITPEDVVNGTFDRCLDLYHHILKKRVEQQEA